MCPALSLCHQKACAAVKRKTLIRKYSEGCLNVLNFQTINNVFKMNWLKPCLAYNNSIPNFVFDQCGGLRFLISCNFISGKLSIKPANFHKQVQDTSKIVFKHTFSLHTAILWNDQHVVYNNKTLFLRDGYVRGIIVVADLLNSNTTLPPTMSLSSK